MSSELDKTSLIWNKNYTINKTSIIHENFYFVIEKKITLKKNNKNLDIKYFDKWFKL